MTKRIAAIAAVHALLRLAALAADPAESLPDKRGFSLTNPTPDALLRDLSTDRPDKTESAYTVDAGRFQVELDALSYTHDRDRSGGGDTRTKTLACVTTNLKLGLRHDLDVQLVVESFMRVRTEDRATGTTTRQSGFGDTTIRVKKNFWGNDRGPTALAVMPFVKLPTNRGDLGNNAVEAGIIVPLAVELPAGWGMGLMTEVDWLRDDTGNGRHATFVNSITFGHDIAGDLGGYIEVFTERSTESKARWVTTLDLGFTYGIGKNIQLDAGVNIGFTKAADDVGVFVGFSRRF